MEKCSACGIDTILLMCFSCFKKRQQEREQELVAPGVSSADLDDHLLDDYSEEYGIRD